jgi:cyclomaltodextrinase / maltogenic alpha-amylase / neopullulanase
MKLEALYHRPKQNWSYAYDAKTVHLRLRTQKDDMQSVHAITGDKYIWKETEQAIAMYKLSSDALFDYWEAAVQPPFRRLCYYFHLLSGKEHIYFSERGCSTEAPAKTFGNFEFPFLNSADIFQPPAWVKDAVFYQIFPERFANGDPSLNPENVQPWGSRPTAQNYFGGDLQGVMDHLDYLQKLGISAIYFTPLFQANTNHKYDTSDYLQIDSQFGSNETLKELVAACHKRGIRILLDAVFNHSGKGFPPFVDLLEKGQDSVYKDWFHVREWPLQIVNGRPSYETFAFESHMPKLNTENTEVREYLLKAAKYWIEEIDIDGWRLDVANEVDHRFWREFRDVVKAAKPDAYILGEIWHDSMPWLQGDQFDAVMNYPVTDAALDFFARNQMDSLQFANAIGNQLAAYPLQVKEASFNLLGSHDTPRILTLCKNNKDRMKLAALFQFTYIGTPCIYYGDEIGLTGGNDPECRKCMEWDETKQDLNLLQFHQALISMRKNHSALRTGSFHFLHAKQGDQRLAYERSDEHGHYVILINAHKRSRSIQVSIKSGVWNDIASDTVYETKKGKLKVTLPGFGYQILRFNF